ncbi:MAG: hypothetical protein Q6K90_02190 [Gloeomargarita sp. HHBFW_bins_162]
MRERSQRWLTTLLMLDVFLVLAGFAWFALALLGQGFWPQLWETWVFLWQPLWQPAIGVFMLGALVTGALNWWQNRPKG